MGKKGISVKGVLWSRAIRQKVCMFLYIEMLCTKLDAQKWLHLFLEKDLLVHKDEVVEFYMNLSILEDNVATSKVYGVELIFDKVYLSEILLISLVGLAEYIWKKNDNCVLTLKFTYRRMR